jgi:hypothetical protein
MTSTAQEGTVAVISFLLGAWTVLALILWQKHRGHK